MAYDDNFWIEVKERYLKGESPAEISSSLNGKPSTRTIERRRISDKWDEKKAEIVNTSDNKMSQNVADFLKTQHDIYEKISTRFENSIDELDMLGRPQPFCSVKDVVTLYKDWRELFNLRREEGKPKADLEKQIIKQQEAIKHPVLKALFDQAEQLQDQIEAVYKELGL